MSTYELKNQKEERPGFTGVKLSELRPGMVIYRHGFPDLPRDNDRLCRFVFERYGYCAGDVEMKRIPIGLDYRSRWSGNRETLPGLLCIYSREPTMEYMVVDGLGLPGELMFEVYRYCKC